MAAAIPVMAVAGGMLNAAGAVNKGQAEQLSQYYQANIAEQNAVLTRQQSAEDERRARVMGRKMLGDARTAYASSGVQMEGSALDVLQESAANAELDALTIRYKGEVAARGYENEANFRRSAGNKAMDAGYLSAAGSLMAGAAGAYGKMK
jgi:hypothetical protein